MLIDIMLEDPGSRGGAHSLRALRVGEKLANGFGDGPWIAGRNQQPGHFRNNGVA